MSNANTNLMRLYRRFTRSAPVQSLPQTDALLALADGEHSAEAERLLGDVARSAVHADLLRFARALAPESARLGVQFEQAFEISVPGHREARRQSSRHVAARRGWLRMTASMAACLLVAIFVWSVQQRHAAPPPASALTASAMAPDRIFAALDDAARPGKSDEIFRGAFSRDQIFQAKFNGG